MTLPQREKGASVFFFGLIGIYIILNALPAGSGINNMLNDPYALIVLKAGQIILSILLFVIPPVFFAYYVSGDVKSYLKFRSPARPESFIYTAFAVLAATPLINLLADMNGKMHLPSALSGIETWMRQKENDAAVLTEAFLKMDSSSALLVNLLMIAVIPAIGEEFMCRGVMQRLFSGWMRNRHAGVWLAAVIFSALHFQFFGFIPRMLLGAMLGYLFLWSNSIWLPVTAHFVNNGSAIIISYMNSHGILRANLDNIGAGENEWRLTMLSSAVFGGLLYAIFKREKRGP